MAAPAARVRDEEPYHEGLRAAAEAGWTVLEAGGAALDAVQAAAVALEDDPLFNAGRGAVLNEHRRGRARRRDHVRAHRRAWAAWPPCAGCATRSSSRAW